MFWAIGVIIFFILLTVYSSCRVSSRCSREEEKPDT